MGRQPFSGYCTTCRRRRVKCDRSRPACSRCVKAGFNCEGYGMTLRMQHLVIGDQGLIKVPGSVSALRPPQVPQELSLVGFHEQIAFSFFFSSYRWAYFWRPLMRTTCDGNSDLNYKASLATTLGYLAAQKNNSALAKQAVELYSRTVAELQTTLSQGSKPDLARFSSVIAALSIYNYTIDRKFIYVHHYGIKQITKWCGPICFQEEPNLTSFRIGRLMLYCLSLAFKCKLFLAEDAWKSIPFQHISKTMEDKLLDLLVDIPGLAENVIASHHSKQTIEKAAEKLQSLQLGLSGWRKEWNTIHPHSAREVTRDLSSNSITPPLIKSLLSTSIRLQTAQQALELLNYNSAMLYLSNLHCILNGDCPRHQTVISVTQYIGNHSPESLNGQRGSPLQLPEEIEFPWQYGIEGLRILACIRAELPASSGVYLTFAPIGVLYCFSKSLEIQQNVISMISNDLRAEEADEVFGAYEVNIADNLFEILRDNTSESTMEDENQKRSSIIRQMFIRS